MAITNGYLTLAEAKKWIHKYQVYTATTISFTSGTKTIADSAYALKRFVSGDSITIAGSTANDGTYTIASGTNAASFTVDQSLTTEAAGQSVTITQIVSQGTAVDPIEDSVIEQSVEAASRAIDLWTGRSWFAQTDTRYYVVGEDTHGTILELDRPLLTVTTLTNGDGTALTATTHYLLEPRNGEYYTRIRLTESGGKYWNYTTNQYEDTISVAGTWGIATSADDNVKMACYILTKRLYNRREAWFGVKGMSAMGEVTNMIPGDKDIMGLLPSQAVWSSYFGNR